MSRRKGQQKRRRRGTLPGFVWEGDSPTYFSADSCDKANHYEVGPPETPLECLVAWTARSQAREDGHVLRFPHAAGAVLIVFGHGSAGFTNGVVGNSSFLVA